MFSLARAIIICPKITRSQVMSKTTVAPLLHIQMITEIDILTYRTIYLLRFTDFPQKYLVNEQQSFLAAYVINAGESHFSVDTTKYILNLQVTSV